MAPQRLRLVIDLNVVLDVLQRREPHYPASAQALAAAEAGAFEGWVAAHHWTTLYYLYAKHTSPKQARLVLTQLLTFLKVAPVDGQVLERALQLPYTDFEDAVCMAAAMGIKARYVLTRNLRDFRSGPLPAITPEEFLLHLRGEQPHNAP